MNELSELERRMAAIESRQSSLETIVTRIDTTVNHSLASREWVKELVAPIVENTRETRHLVEMQGRDMQTLNAAHNKLLEARAQQEKEEHEAKMAALQDQTWSNLLKNKWAPVAAFIVALAVILNHLSTLLLSWMGAHGMK
ncbi:hypothetical protein IAD21_00668 [Abditibacteriota bacterium]|nr:hypothetical protein IAD21_00668 [Abditibacteriota bacterium]